MGERLCFYVSLLLSVTMESTGEGKVAVPLVINTWPWPHATQAGKPIMALYGGTLTFSSLQHRKCRKSWKLLKGVSPKIYNQSGIEREGEGEKGPT